MKNKKIYIIIFLVIIITLEGFFIWKNIDKAIILINYTRSLRTWNELVKEKGGSYFYQTSFGSMEGNYSNKTKITVKNNIPVAREYEESISEIDSVDPVTKMASFKKEILSQYSEDELSLGKNQKGHPAITIDSLYKKCRDKLDVSPKENYIYFETNDHGIISTCGYVPIDCMDDCFNGVDIAYFEWIE